MIRIQIFINEIDKAVPELEKCFDRSDLFFDMKKVKEALKDISRIPKENWDRHES